MVAVVSAALGVGGTLLIRSPGQAALESAPPPVTVLLEKVRRDVLTQTVTASGTVTDGATFDVVPASPRDGSVAVITGEPVAVGKTVAAGSVVLEVADRPVFVLPGSIPLRRDLGQGMSGDDVARFQKSLRAAKLTVTDRDGVFGSSTAAAVRSLYARAGYEAPPWGSPLVTSAEFSIVRGGLPGRVVALGGRVGDVLGKDPAVTIATSSPDISILVNPALASAFDVDMTVSLSSTAAKVPAEGTVVFVGAPVESEDSGVQVPMRVTTTEPLDTGAAGAQVQVSVTAPVADDPGLIVPVSALRAAEDGTTYVLRVAGGKSHKVEVVVLATADGRALIADTPDLAADDEVDVGVGVGSP